MARNLSFELDQISLGETAKRSPAWTIAVYDVRSGGITIPEIVSGTFDPNEALFIHDYVSLARGTERAGDYIQAGVAATIVDFTVQDPDGQFDPDAVLGDPAALGRFFRSGNVVRIVYGDERLDPSKWVPLFFGIIAGQAGYSRGRAPLISELLIRAYGREASFMSLERTSAEFSFDPVVTYLQIAETVATEEMGLTDAEINLFGFGDQDLRHGSMTLAKESPMSMLAKVMFSDGFLPKFTGGGVLEQTRGYATNSTDRFYDVNDAILSISRPLVETTPPDAICVVGLDFELSLITQPVQVVAEVEITTGYFTSGEEISVFWSDDKTQLVSDVTFEVIKSVNGGFSRLGGGEDAAYIDAPTGTLDVATIGAVITIDTGFAPWIGVFLLTTYVVLAAVPDLIVGGGVFVITGVTISVGSLAQAGALAGAMIVMTKIGRGSYKFKGTPIEYVYSEIRECARADGTSEFTENQIEVKNHLVDNRTDAQAIAAQLLFRQQALVRERSVRMIFDPGLEPDDVFETLTDGRRFLVATIAWELKRDADPSKSAVSTVKAGEVTDGVAVTT